MEVATILAQVDLGSVALPEFQRGYVWNRDQVRSLMYSLYHRYPVGSLMVWLTKTEDADVRGDGQLSPGSVKLLLDGQQRITTLYGIIKGHAPKFFDGNAQAFTGLHFHLDDETFEFYAPAKMKDNPLWVNVTELMKKDAGEFIGEMYPVLGQSPKFTQYLKRLNALDGIKKISFHIEEVAGEDKTVDIVVDIFNRVNSGGTKLSKGDLALAKICAEWPQARDEMKLRLDKWRKREFAFRLDWLLRNINAIVTGEALFSALRDVEIPEFQQGLVQAERAIDTVLNMIGGRLGLDSDSVLGGSACIPLMSRYLSQRGGQLADYKERDKLLYWYIHTFLWGRYAGSTETVLNQDLDAIKDTDGGLDRLISLLRQNRGDLRVHPTDFMGWNRGARFYPLLYMLTRVYHAQDWDTGIELSNHLLGHLSRLEVHHIFPKALLYKHGNSRPEANALANFAFLTQETNLHISDRPPAEYLPEFAAKHPGALESHWIPMDPELWKVENYSDFLAARRDLLAQAANSFLASLLSGSMPEATVTATTAGTSAPVVAVMGADEHEEAAVEECDEWIRQQGLPKGEYMYELAEPTTKQPLAVLDLAWPDGLQAGYSQPVAFLVDVDAETEHVLNTAGYRYFTNLTDFRSYVERDILAISA